MSRLEQTMVKVRPTICSHFLNDEKSQGKASKRSEITSAAVQGDAGMLITLLNQ